MVTECLVKSLPQLCELDVDPQVSVLLAGLVRHRHPLPVVLVHRQPRLTGVSEAGVGGVVPLHRSPLWVTGAVDVLNNSDVTKHPSTYDMLADVVVFLATVYSRRVHGLLPADLRVDHPDLLPVVGDGHPRQQERDHVEPVNVGRTEPAPDSLVVVVPEFYAAICTKTHLFSFLQCSCLVQQK